MSAFETNLSKDLHQYLMNEKLVDEKLPECPDIEDLWHSLEEIYLPDGIREFNDYPTVSLGWMMFVGMAFAFYWDIDWEKYSKMSVDELYKSLRDAKGYDNMDDYILKDVLNLPEEEAEKMSEIVGECASRALSLLHHSNLEPGTKEAALAYVDALHQMYLMGIALELNNLGYHMTLMG
ncbi:MAG: hypothetical protein K2M10_02595, partial [Muribaculaceae bacterium]|nr:hypothetical protein [Muribaculaceae bacterium]